MAIFVINEWLWSDLSGDNGPKPQFETFSVIEKLPASEHRIVLIEGSPFDLKAWKMCKSTNPMVVQRIGGLFVKIVRENLDLCIILRPESVAALPDDLASTIKADDHYLLRTQLSVPGAILVTTDNPLREAVEKAGRSCLSRKEFLSIYF